MILFFGIRQVKHLNFRRQRQNCTALWRARTENRANPDRLKPRSHSPAQKYPFDFNRTDSSSHFQRGNATLN